jgi:hypothetical protein
MNRRTLLKVGTGMTAVVLAGRGLAAFAADEGLLRADLEPDRDWPIYRRYRLLIVGQSDDATASALAAAVVAVLARFLPAARAQLARAADSRRVGVLIGTNQQDVAIMTAASAEALFLARQPFTDIRNVPLRIIVSFGSHVLVCREDLMVDHGYVLARTLAEHKDALPVSVGAPEGVVPAHRGSRAFFDGAGMPTPTNSA